MLTWGAGYAGQLGDGTTVAGDSCAAPDNDLMNALWPDRARVQTVLLPTGARRARLLRSSLRLERGDIHGVLGANGSGKSTLIRLVSGLLTLDEGRVEVFGHDLATDEMAVKRLINRVSVDAAFFKKLSPMENLLFAARLYGKDAGEAHLFGDDHYRTYLDPQVVVEEIEARGGTVMVLEQGHGMAVYKSEDPHVARIVASWSE